MDKQRIILLDEGFIKHKAIFSYIAQLKENREKLIQSENVSEEVARRMLEIKMRNNLIFIPKPTLTFMRMVVGYLKRLNVTSDDKIILAIDFGSWRKKLDEKYKQQRKGKREEKESNDFWMGIYKEFNNLYERIDPYINWNLCRRYLVESDDWAAVTAKVFTDRPVILISSDADWQMLCAYENVKIFSPITKKFKEVKNPLGVLASKINGDISDNLLSAPSSEREFSIRNKIVNLLELPEEIEKPLKEELLNLPLKNLYVEKLPYKSVREELKKLYT